MFVLFSVEGQTKIGFPYLLLSPMSIPPSIRQAGRHGDDQWRI